MKLRTIQIVQVRAMDLPAQAVVRRSVTQAQALDRPEKWRYLYDKVPGGLDAPDYFPLMRENAEKLDERWVQLRLSDDPDVHVPTSKTMGVTTQKVISEPPIEYEDTVRVEQANTLYDVQVVVEREASIGTFGEKEEES